MPPRIALGRQGVRALSTPRKRVSRCGTPRAHPAAVDGSWNRKEQGAQARRLCPLCRAGRPQEDSGGHGAPASKGQWHDWRAVVQGRWVRIVVTAVVLLGGVGYIVNSVLRKPLLEPQRGQISPRVISKFPADRW